MGERERTNLKEIVADIQGKRLLLPDFQRGFVWDLDMQKRLVASVLARMPLGSILILDADADDYGCRILGRKESVSLDGQDKKLRVLLDGQQRLTVLTNIFSNLLYYDYENKGNLITQYKNVISSDLKNRFFLRIPCIERLEKKDDLFGLLNLKFALNNPDRTEENWVENPESEKVFPKFLTEDIRDYIEILGFDKDSKESYAPHAKGTRDIIDDSIKHIKKEDYLIPLYFLIDNGIDGIRSELILNRILRKIVDKVVLHRYNEEYLILENEEEKRAYIESHLDVTYQEDVFEEGKDQDKCFLSKWADQGEKEWGDKMHTYLKFCISSMNLHQIIVPESERERAIDIYENLNLGGITLSTFELVLAKASKIKFEDNSNLYEQMLQFMQEPKEYDEVLLPERLEEHFDVFKEENPDYSATEFLECYDKRKHEFRRKYTDVFLNVLSLLSYVPDYDADKIETNLIKRDKILGLRAEEIHTNYRRACIGIDRALFFLQARCGVRKIQEVNYYLMLVLLGYILAEDAYYKDKRLVKRLEGWYWSSIFAGRYDKDQTEHVKEDIRFFLKGMKENRKEEFAWLENRKEKIFAIEDFSDEATLLMETHTVPKNVLRTSICQFYLSGIYEDLLEKEKLHPFSENVKELEEHHIVPVGRLDTPYKKMADARKDKMNLFNSPVNFAYVSKSTNKKISNLPYEVYCKSCTQGSIFSLKLTAGCETLGEEDVRKLLKERLDRTREAVKERIG